MALTFSGKNAANIELLGGGSLKVTNRSSAGAALTTDVTPHDVGYIADSTYGNKVPGTDIFDESGALIDTEVGNRTVTLDVTLLQREAQLIEDMAYEVENNYYLAMHQTTKTDAIGTTKTQYHFIYGKFDIDLSLKLPDGKLPCKFKGLALSTSVSLTAGELTVWNADFTAGAATVTIPAGRCEKFVEV